MLDKLRLEEELTSVEVLKKLLVGDDSHKMTALKRLVGCVAMGKYVEEVFVDIVNLVSSPVQQIRRLSHIYIQYHVSLNEEVAIMAISSLQSQLLDRDHVVRANTIKILASMNLLSSIPTLQEAIQTGVSDSSPLVRRTSYAALLSYVDILESNDAYEDQHDDFVLTTLERGFKDRIPFVLSMVYSCWNALLPDSHHLVHDQYFKMVKYLADLDETGILATLDILNRYVRIEFTDPQLVDADDVTEDIDFDIIHADHRKYIDALKILLLHSAPCVITKVVEAMVSIAPRSELHVVVDPILRLLRHSKSLRPLLLKFIEQLMLIDPSLFEHHFKLFLLQPMDTHEIARTKLRLLAAIISEENVHFVVSYLFDIILRCSFHVQKEIVDCLGKISFVQGGFSQFILLEAIKFLRSHNLLLVNEVLVLVKNLVKRHISVQPTVEDLDANAIFSKLVAIVFSDTVLLPESLVAVLYLCGEYLPRILHFAPDMLRVIALNFKTYEVSVKLEALSFVVKCMKLFDPRLLNPKKVEEVVEEPEETLDDFLASEGEEEEEKEEEEEEKESEELVAEEPVPEKPVFEEPATEEPVIEAKSVYPDELNTKLIQIVDYIFRMCHFDGNPEVRDKYRLIEKSLEFGGSFIEALCLNMPAPVLQEDLMISSGLLMCSMSFHLGRRLEDYYDLPIWSTEVNKHGLRVDDTEVVMKEDQGFTMDDLSSGYDDEYDQYDDYDESEVETDEKPIKLVEPKIELEKGASLDDWLNSDEEEEGETAPAGAISLGSISLPVTLQQPTPLSPVEVEEEDKEDELEDAYESYYDSEEELE
ncbi:hypothetical protein PCE1_000768 [Barthelona sp. PCE]